MHGARNVRQNYRASTAEHDPAIATCIGKEVLDLGMQPSVLEIEALHLDRGGRRGRGFPDSREQSLPGGSRLPIDLIYGCLR